MTERAENAVTERERVVERYTLRAYFETRAGELVAVESMPLAPAVAGEVWAYLSRATLAEWWVWGNERPALKHGARHVVAPRWEDVKQLRRIVIAERVKARSHARTELRTEPTQPAPPRRKKRPSNRSPLTVSKQWLEARRAIDRALAARTTATPDQQRRARELDAHDAHDESRVLDAIDRIARRAKPPRCTLPAIAREAKLPESRATAALQRLVDRGRARVVETQRRSRGGRVGAPTFEVVA